MATLPTYFTDFLSNIRLTDNQKNDCRTGHETLRDRLMKYDGLKGIIVSTFLQGSYKRATAVRPLGDSRSDVDVIVVTKLDKESVKPDEALEKFREFLKEYYKGKYSKQGRSWGIELSYVSLDLVPTTTPSEAAEKMISSLSVLDASSIDEVEEWPFGNERKLFEKSRMFFKSSSDWRNEPLWIPDRHASEWVQTDPLTQINKTYQKNKACNGHFVNVVKCLKWWRKAMKPIPKYPKSYPLEHLIYLTCPDDIKSVAEGIVISLEKIRDLYKDDAEKNKTPFVPDHGIPEHNVFSRVTGEDFAAFHSHVTNAAEFARKAYDETVPAKSAELWKNLFGCEFPSPPKKDKASGNSDQYSPRQENSIIHGSRGRFA